MTTITRKGMICTEIDRDTFEAQRTADCELQSKTEQCGYDEYHYATDDYDIYVFVRGGKRYRFYSNKDA